jgi:tetratricopeptide (TPR) repeat protein
MFQGQLDEAGKYYERAVKMGSGYPYLPTQLAQLETKRGNYPKALELATQAYERNISDPQLAASAITEILFAYQKMPGNTDQEEEKWHTKRRELEPSAWNWDAHASFRLYRFGDYEKAIEYGTKALSIMDFGVGRYTLAAANYTKWAAIKNDPARQAEAERAFRDARQLYPDTSDMIRQLAASSRLKPVGEALQKRLSESR